MSNDWDSMTTDSEYIKLVDNVADLRSKLQHGRTRLLEMKKWLTLLSNCDAEAIEIALWRDAIQDQEIFLEALNTQLCEYESLVGWR